MPKVHPRPWHRGSVFGDGPRRPLDREQRARFRFLLNAHRRGRRLTPTAELVGNALVRRLGQDGRLDPSHDRLAEDVGCCARTVRRGLATLRALGLVTWMRRIVRIGDAVEQVSNGYCLMMPKAPAPAQVDRKSSGGHSGRQTKTLIHQGLTYLLPISGRDREAARDALAQRRRVVEASLLTRVAEVMT
jgi:hypothetical protein